MCRTRKLIGAVMLAIGLVAAARAADALPSGDLLREEYFKGAAATQPASAWVFPPGLVDWVTEDGRACLKVHGDGSYISVQRREPLPTPHVLSLEFKFTQSFGMIGVGPCLVSYPSGVYTTDRRAVPGTGWTCVSAVDKLSAQKWYHLEVENHLMWSKLRLREDGEKGRVLIDDMIVWHDPLPGVTVMPVMRNPIPANETLYFTNLQVRPVTQDPPTPAVAAPSAPDGLKLVLWEDFNGPRLTQFGSIRNMAGRLYLPAPNYWSKAHLVNVPDLDLADGVIQFRIQLKKSTSMWVRMRMDYSDRNGYALQLDAGQPPQFLRLEDQAPKPIGTFDKDLKLQEEQSYDVKVELKGQGMAAYLNGKKVAEAQDPQGSLSRGGFGFMGHGGGPSSIDNLAIFSQQGKYAYTPQPVTAVQRIEQPEQNPDKPYEGFNWWRTSWVSVPAASDANGIMLERRFTVEGSPGCAFLNIAADGKYTVKLNGNAITPKPIDGHWFVGYVADLTKSIRTGQNVLQVQITSQGKAPALAAVVACQMPNGEWRYVTSDDQWTAKPDDRPLKVLGKFGMDQRPWIYSLMPATAASALSVALARDLPQTVVRDDPIELELTVTAPGGVSFMPAMRAYLLADGAKDEAANRVYLYAEEIGTPTPIDKGVKVNLRLHWTTPARYMLKPGQTVQLGLTWDHSTLCAPGSAPVGKFTIAPQNAAEGSVLSAYQATAEGMKYQGRIYKPVAGSDGALFVRYDPNAMPADQWKKLVDEEMIRKLQQSGVTYKPVLSRVVDYVDVTSTGHGFDEDGGIGGRSRLMQIAGETFRVTEPRASVSPYFVYDLEFAVPSIPHVVVFRVPNDIARVTTINPIPAETGSGGAYTGVAFPLDGRAYNQTYVYYPPLKKVTFCVYCYPLHAGSANKVPVTPQSGAAISGLWSLALERPIDEYAVQLPPGAPRKLGIDYTSPETWVGALYGVNKPKTAEDRQAAWASFLDYSRFSGSNAAYINFIGSDWIGQADNVVMYDSKILGPNPKGHDFFKELVPQAEELKFHIVPTMAAFMLDESIRKRLDLTSPEVFLIDPTGKQMTSFGTPKLNPANPKVRDAFYSLLGELASRSAKSPAIDTIAVRVNGFGLSFGGGSYDPFTLGLFRKETGVEVPTDNPKAAYDYLKANAWDKWTDWRCGKTAELWRGARDIVQAQRKDMKLVLMLQTVTTFAFKRLDYPSRLEDLRLSSFDPAMLANEPGLSIQEVWVWEARYSEGAADWPWQTYPDRQAGGLAHSLSSWTGYWEQAGPFGGLTQFTIGWLASANALSVDRYFFELPVYGLVKLDATDFNLQTWERGLAEQELNLRRFGRAFCPLSLDPPQPFKGKVEVKKGTLKAADVQVVFRGRQLSVINTSGQGGVIAISGDPAKGPWRELGRQETYRDLGEIDLLPYDVLTFEPASP